MTRIIADTSALVPRIDRGDSLRQPAVSLWEALEHRKWEVVFFDCIANETLSVLCRRFRERHRPAEWPAAFDCFREFCHLNPPLWSSQHIQRLFGAIVDLVGEHQGRLNFHDALVALLARELDIPYILSFDPDFDAISWLKRVASPDALQATKETL